MASLGGSLGGLTRLLQGGGGGGIDLSSILGGLGGMGGGGADDAKAQRRAGMFDGLEGNDLYQAGIDAANQQQQAYRRHAQQTRASSGMDPYQSYKSDLADSLLEGRQDADPWWKSFWGIMNAKGAHVRGDVGRDMFQEGAVGPNGSVSPIGVSYDTQDILGSSPLTRGSMANRSGLSLQALRTLAGGR